MTEVPLSLEQKLKNIEETEAAKKRMLAIVPGGAGCWGQNYCVWFQSHRACDVNCRCWGSEDLWATMVRSACHRRDRFGGAASLCAAGAAHPSPTQLGCNQADDDDDFGGGGGGPLRRGAYPVSFGKQNPKHLQVIAEAQ